MEMRNLLKTNESYGGRAGTRTPDLLRVKNHPRLQMLR